MLSELFRFQENMNSDLILVFDKNRIEMNLFMKKNSNPSAPQMESFGSSPAHSPYFDKYIVKEALLKGSFSDITIRAFNKDYKLHKLFIQRSPFFQSLISWSTASNQVKHKASNTSISTTGSFEDKNGIKELYFDDDPGFITQQSFELLIKRLYFVPDLQSEQKIPLQMLETGSYFGLNDIISDAFEFLQHQMKSMNMVGPCLKYFLDRDHGDLGSKLIEKCKYYLLKNGWECGPDYWDDVPCGILSDIVGKDYFFIPNEYDRSIFIIKLIERRIEIGEHPAAVSRLRDVLNHEVIYCHIPMEKLFELEKYADSEGNSFISKEVIMTSAWELLHLQSQILNAKDKRIDFISRLGPDAAKTFPYFGADVDIKSSPSEVDDYILGKLRRYVIHSTQIPPLRVSIAFAGIAELEEESALFSKSVFYAGSYWTLIITKKKTIEGKPKQIAINVQRNIHRKDVSVGWQKNDNRNLYEDNVNYLSSPKKKKPSSLDPETDIANFPIITIDYDSESRFKFTDTRVPIHAYMTMHSFTDDDNANVRIKSYLSLQHVNNYYITRTWTAFDDDGYLKYDFTPFKLCLILGIV